MKAQKSFHLFFHLTLDIFKKIGINNTKTVIIKNNMNFELFLTQNAENFLKKKLGESQSLQIRIKNTGCSGYAYDLKYTEKKPEHLIFRGVSFDIKEEDKIYLINSVINLKTEGLNSKLVFENPQSINECGCGESFSLKVIK